MKHLTKRDIASNSKRDLIYETSICLFKQKGYDHTSMKDISQETGMSIGSIYHFYQNKGEILRRFGLSLTDSLPLALTPDNIQNPKDALYQYLVQVSVCFEDAGYDLLFHLHKNADSIWMNKDGEYVVGSSIHKIVPFLQKAMEEQTLKSQYSIEQIINFIHIACLGILNAWIVREGKPSLSRMTEEFLAVLFQSLF